MSERTSKKSRINRRDFVKRSTVAIAATTGLGLANKAVTGSLLSAPPDKVDLLVRAASSAKGEINDFLRASAEEIRAMRRAEDVKGQVSVAECAKAQSIVEDIVRVVVDVVVATYSFGSGPFGPLVVRALGDVTAWETSIRKQNKITKEIDAALRKLRGLVDAARDAVIARDVYEHLSKDRAHAAKLIEAARTKNLKAVAEVLQTDASGRKVDVREAGAENESFFLNVRLGSLTHCLSTLPRCQGKLFSITR
jgi:hypothetical protein